MQDFLKKALLVFAIAALAAQMKQAVRLAAPYIAPAAKAGIFNLESDYGQDLYKTVYEKLKNEGSDMAAKRMMANQGLSQGELKLLTSEAGISQFMAVSTLKEKLSPQQIEARRAALLREFQEEKFLADLESQLDMEVVQTEIFANGNEEDSGFDLISDLDLIEEILFGEDESGEGGAGGSGSGQAAGGAAGQTQRSPAQAQDESDQGGALGAGAGKKAGGADGQPANQQADADAANVICPLHADFNSAIEKLRNEEKAAGAKTVGKRTGSSEEEGSGAGSGGGPTPSAGTGAQPKPLEPEKPDDWSRPQLCGEVFCLKIEMVYKKASSYSVTESCIACHFEKINDSFKKLLDHGLVPAKVAGNSMEMPTCKRYSGALKFNLITIPRPIVTPPNDDLVVKGDFIKNMAGFIDEYYLNNPPARAAEDLLKQTTAATDPRQLLDKIAEKATDKANAAAKFLKEAQLTSKASDQASQYRVIMQEVDTMNSYFESFVQLFNQIAGENDPNAPCPVLTNLPKCS